MNPPFKVPTRSSSIVRLSQIAVLVSLTLVGVALQWSLPGIATSTFRASGWFSPVGLQQQQQQQQGGMHALAFVNSTSPGDSAGVRPFVGVLSSPGNFQARAVIRDTWGSDKRVARLMFFTLRPESNMMFRQLRREAAELGDVVIAAEVFTSYYNITYSTYEIFKTAARIGGFTHVIKADDDTYVRWDLLLPALANMPTEWLYAGFPMKQELIRRTGKHGVSRKHHWPYQKTPPYAYGWGYVVSMDIARDIAAGVPVMLMEPGNFLPLEDVAVGFWIDFISQDRHVRINYRVLQAERSDHVCSDKSMLVHLKPTAGTPWDMMQCMFQSEGRCCSCTDTGCHPVPWPSASSGAVCNCSCQQHS